jgi:hypothetical protein
MLTSLCIMAPYTIFQNVYRSDLIDQRIPLSTHGCPSQNTSIQIPPSSFYESHWKSEEDTLGIRMLSMSYMWHSGLTCSITVLTGIIYSLIHRFNLKGTAARKEKLINPKCISPCLLTLWLKLFPNFMASVLEKPVIVPLSQTFTPSVPKLSFQK